MRKIKFRVWDKYRNEYLSGGNVFIGIKPGQLPLDSVIYNSLRAGKPTVSTVRMIVRALFNCRYKFDYHLQM